METVFIKAYHLWMMVAGMVMLLAAYIYQSYQNAQLERDIDQLTPLAKIGVEVLAYATAEERLELTDGGKAELGRAA